MSGQIVNWVEGYGFKARHVYSGSPASQCTHVGNFVLYADRSSIFCIQAPVVGEGCVYFYMLAHLHSLLRDQYSIPQSHLSLD